MLTFNSRSPEETKKIGEKIGKKLKKGSIVLLSGELGAGKTTLVKGIAKSLGFKKEDDVTSPTFALIHEYAAKIKIYHIDWYRMKKVQGDDAEMARECFGDDAVTLVEWPERGTNIWPEKYIEIKIQHQSSTARIIQVSTVGAGF